MSQREEILDAIRHALGRGPLEEGARRKLDERSSEPPAHLRPAIAETDLVARFAARLESRAGTTARLASLAEVPAAVAALATELGIDKRAVVGRGLVLAWPADWRIEHGAAGIDTRLGVSPAFLGIAETGALVMRSGPDSPTTHNFVPETHVVVLPATCIVRHYEDAWTVLRERGEPMPRALNVIAGPSRTGDVEQTIELGAHGPRRLHVLIVGSATD